LKQDAQRNHTTRRKKGRNTMNCKSCQTALPDLLLDDSTRTDRMAASQRSSAEAHVAACSACAQELASLQATMSLLDGWETPQISPYFDQKLAVRLREEQAAPAAGWFEQLKTRLLLNTGRQFRPAMAGALALVLVLGGGGIGIVNYPHPAATEASATVKDLQILDKNEQALQQMDQLLQDDQAPADNAGSPPQS
jgi:hypothetical protein